LGGVGLCATRQPHASVSRTALQEADRENLIRLSVGLEDGGDLLEDLRRALTPLRRGRATAVPLLKGLRHELA
jgi:cystathionine beta-lyase/cystathionine gamma-synthase